MKLYNSSFEFFGFKANFCNIVKKLANLVQIMIIAITKSKLNNCINL